MVELEMPGEVDSLAVSVLEPLNGVEPLKEVSTLMMVETPFSRHCSPGVSAELPLLPSSRVPTE
jgi:hypothetical protein